MVKPSATLRNRSLASFPHGLLKLGGRLQYHKADGFLISSFVAPISKCALAQWLGRLSLNTVRISNRSSETPLNVIDFPPSWSEPLTSSAALNQPSKTARLTQALHRTLISLSQTTVRRHTRFSRQLSPLITWINCNMLPIRLTCRWRCNWTREMECAAIYAETQTLICISDKTEFILLGYGCVSFNKLIAIHPNGCLCHFLSHFIWALTHVITAEESF